MKKNLILKYINKFPGITLAKLTEISNFSKPSIYNYIIKLQNDNLIKRYYDVKNKKIYRLHPTKKGKELYLQNKIKFLLENNIISEVDAIAPCICDGCIYSKDKLNNLLFF